MSSSMKSIVFVILAIPFTNGFLDRAEVDADAVSYQLFTPQNPTQAQYLKLDDVGGLQSSNFDNNLPTKIFAHGHYGAPSLANSARDAYLQRGDCNVISVDWSNLAAGEYSSVALNNVPTAGVTTGAFLNFLISNGANVSAFHLIGFDMGAHVLGMAAANVSTRNIPRITGLDPVSADFPLEKVEVRLDTTDAYFVDIIHTFVTYASPIGSVDFYPNGGEYQPGCPVNENICCSHCRAVELFAESISNPTGFDSLRCNDYANFVSGACNNNNHIYLGENVNTNARGSYFLFTNSQSPYAQGPVMVTTAPGTSGRIH